MSGKEGRARIWAWEAPEVKATGASEWPASLRDHYERALVLICSLLLLQGLQGIQGPKVSSRVWMKTLLLATDPKPGQFQKALLMGQARAPCLASDQPCTFLGPEYSESPRTGAPSCPHLGLCSFPFSCCPAPSPLFPPRCVFPLSLHLSLHYPISLCPRHAHLSLNCPQP